MIPRRTSLVPAAIVEPMLVTTAHAKRSRTLAYFGPYEWLAQH